MYTPVYTNQFAKDVKKARKRGKNLDKFKVIAEISGVSVDFNLIQSYELHSEGGDKVN